MSIDRWKQVEALFNELAPLSPEQRKARLDAACGDDAQLRQEVESLLAHSVDTDHPDRDNVRRSIARAAGDLAGAPDVGGSGRRLGPWLLKDLVAHGGMGAVYLAERADDQFEQRAAIKVLNRMMSSPESLHRFNGERQILANLDHPNVARLIDGGTAADGTPWLAMEFIDGVRIDQYCDTHKLGLRARLELFRKVCGAVEYAHRNLVVHRDIKPSNILVDARGEPKLLDFGIAKLFGSGQQELTATVGDHRALTPRYSSPEQLRGLPLTTATDIYSLTVLLFELLVGRDPYGPAAVEKIGLYRAICETEPQPPSVVMARAAADAAATGSGLSGRALRGDLDNIVLKGLSKEPERRYASVQALSDDIERYLDDEPVAARPDTWTYRTTKFLKRRRAPVLALAGVLLLVATLAGFSINRIVRERDAANAARERAEQMSRFLQDLLSGADRLASAGREVTVRDILDAGAQRVRTELGDQAVERARFAQTIAETYHALSLYEPAMEFAGLALQLRQTALGPANPETLQSMREHAELSYLTGGDTRAAEVELERIRDLQIAALGADSSDLIATYHLIGTLHKVLGEPREARSALRKARELLAKLPPDHAEQRAAPVIVNQIGMALDAMDDREGALAAYREALQLFESTGQADHPHVGAVQHNIGLTLRAQGKMEEALPYLRAAVEHTRDSLGEENEDYEAQMSSLGRTLAQLHRFEEAGIHVEGALAVAEKIYGKEHQYYAYNLVNLARLRHLEGRHREAIGNFERAIAIYHNAFGAYHRFLAAAEIDLANCHIDEGRAARALDLAGGTLSRMRGDPEHERHVEAVGRNVQGRALGVLGRSDEARMLLMQSVADLRGIVGDEHQLTAQAARNLVAFLDGLDEGAAADEYRGLQ